MRWICNSARPKEKHPNVGARWLAPTKRRLRPRAPASGLLGVAPGKRGARGPIGRGGVLADKPEISLTAWCGADGNEWHLDSDEAKIAAPFEARRGAQRFTQVTL